jgi:ubiquinol-cytochrome c reductase cytochrome b subunit
MSRFLNWLDHRTGIREITHAALYEHIPGGARWRYVWGSTLSFCFFVQVITGFILWGAYSPSAQTAWESVYYIQHQMTGGWLLRGVHHFTAHVMVILLVVHFVQVVVDGAYRAPREINFWLGLILMQIVLGLALTGYLLPWDQKGYWATQVATSMLSLVPVIGHELQQLVVGGNSFGHHTLTRFFALHAGVLPTLLAVFLALHVALFRRHGLTVRNPDRGPDATFWPEQLLRDGVACLGVAIVVLVMVLWSNSHPESSSMTTHGAELGAPANPAEAYSAARPETYFLFLYQLLKYLETFDPVVGAVIVPGLVMLSLFLMPFIGRWQLGHRFNIVWTLALLIGAAVLTAMALYNDRSGNTPQSQHYLAAVAEAEEHAHRAVELAGSPNGIPPSGALSLLTQDPKTQGPKLFKQHCASCHSHAPPSSDEILGQGANVIRAEKPSASNLWKFGSREWVVGILDPKKIASLDYFGATTHKEGEMAVWVTENIAAKLAELKGDELKAFQRKVQDVTFTLANESGLLGPLDAEKTARVEAGKKAMVEEFVCIDCHKFHDHGDLGLAPELTRYASPDWLTAFISNPAHERFYPETNDRMPAFVQDPQNPNANRITPDELSLLISWLRGQWYEPAREAPKGNSAK